MSWFESMNNLFFCSCILGEGLDEGMDILHEMILSNRRRRRQNASNHIGPPKPQRRKVRRSQSTYHWQSTMRSMFLWISILILSVVGQLSGSRQTSQKSQRASKTSKKEILPLLEPLPLTVLHNGVKAFLKMMLAYFLTSIILNAKHEKNVVNNQDLFFLFISKNLRQYVETFRCKRKKVLIVPDNYFMFSIQDYLC